MSRVVHRSSSTAGVTCRRGRTSAPRHLPLSAHRAVRHHRRHLSAVGRLVDRQAAGLMNAAQPLACSTVPHRDHRRRFDQERRRCLSPGRLQHAGGGANARCQRERALSQAAKQRLSQLVASGEIDLRRVALRLSERHRGDRAMQLRPLLRDAERARAGVGTTLIGEGLAEPYVCTKTFCPPRKDWCRS